MRVYIESHGENTLVLDFVRAKDKFNFLGATTNSAEIQNDSRSVLFVENVVALFDGEDVQEGDIFLVPDALLSLPWRFVPKEESTVIVLRADANGATINF